MQVYEGYISVKSKNTMQVTRTFSLVIGLMAVINKPSELGTSNNLINSDSLVIQYLSRSSTISVSLIPTVSDY